MFTLMRWVLAALLQQEIATADIKPKKEYIPRNTQES